MKDLIKGETRELTEKEFMLLGEALVADKCSGAKPAKAGDLFGKMKLPFLVDIMVKRLALTGLEYNAGVVLVLATLARPTPARAVMLAHFLAYATRQRGSAVDIVYLVEKLFPTGYPTDAAFEETWNSQKTANGNCLDMMEAWK